MHVHKQPREAQNYFLVYYAASLTQVQTIIGTLVCHNNVIDYLTTNKLFRDRRSEFSSYYDYITVILTALENYEEIPKHSNTITDSMMRWMMKDASTAGPDSSTTTTLD